MLFPIKSFIDDSSPNYTLLNSIMAMHVGKNDKLILFMISPLRKSRMKIYYKASTRQKYCSVFPDPGVNLA